MEWGLQIRQCLVNKTSMHKVSGAMPFIPCASTTLFREFQIYFTWAAVLLSSYDWDFGVREHKWRQDPSLGRDVGRG